MISLEVFPSSTGLVGVAGLTSSTGLAGVSGLTSSVGLVGVTGFVVEIEGFASLTTLRAAASIFFFACSAVTLAPE